MICADWVDEALSPYDALQRFKAHPMVAPLLDGGETVEYLAHMIPEGGFRRLPDLYAAGVMIVGDAAMLVNAVHREGANHAITSGKLAGETAIEAHQAGDFTKATLSAYEKRLWDDAPTLKDLKKYRDASRLLEDNPLLLGEYPGLASDAALDVLTVDDESKREKQWKIIRTFLRERGWIGLISDGIKGGRAMW